MIDIDQHLPLVVINISQIRKIIINIMAPHFKINSQYQEFQIK